MDEKEIKRFLAKQKLNFEDLRDSLLKIKRDFVREFKIEPPSLIELIFLFDERMIKKIFSHLKIKPSRHKSGVSVVAIMTSPCKCPHGKCRFCPGGIKSAYGNVPQSYTGKEPATMRAIRNDYDPYLQTFNRLTQYVLLGVIPEKIELVLMGGTFPAREKEYQEEFVKYSLKAMNDFKIFFKNDEFDFNYFKKFLDLGINSMNDKKREIKMRKKILKLKKKGDKKIDSVQSENETAKVRCIAICVETRPDYAGEKEIKEMLRLGVTRVELGLQTINDNALRYLGRGHDNQQNISAIKELKNAGFKVGYHILLHNINGEKKELEEFKRMFDDSRYKPDFLKIYPLLIIKGTKIYEEYMKKKYKPYNTDEAISLIAKMMKYIPTYCRVMRIQRDISTKEVIAGVNRSNLRQYVDEKLKDTKIDEIRDSEILRNEDILKKIMKLSKNNFLKKIKYKIIRYNSSGGKEYFIYASFYDTLLGFLRLRFPYESFSIKNADKCSIVRELHVYGIPEKIGDIGAKEKIQHLGIGKSLMKMAEKISADDKKKNIYVISGIGVREYYKKLGYKRENNYMTKEI